MTREEIAIELTKLYVENNNMSTTRETRYTTIYQTMLDNIEKEEKSDAQLEIEQLQKENRLLKHRLDVANGYIESRKENMVVEHYDDLKYIINECDLDSTW